MTEPSSLGLPVGIRAGSFHRPAWKEPIMPAYEGGRLVGREQRSWNGVSALTAEVRCDGHMQADLSADCTRLSIFLEEVGGHVETGRNPGYGRRAVSEARGPLSLIPSGMEAWAHSDRIHFMRHLILQFDGATVGAMLDEEIDLPRALAPRLMFFEPRLLQLARLIADECASAEPASRLYGDSLSIAALLCLSRLSACEEPPPKQGGLTPWQLRRVTDYIDVHLAEDVQLRTLADLAKLSRSHFCRAFKASTGLAPHRWQLQARIAKAKELLLEGEVPLAQIAVATGFADQSHFTRTFSRATGSSPGAWQRSRCN